MNRGCVFASRDLARCGTLQKCGQAAAAAAAAETASQEPSPAPPTSPWCGGTPGESLQSSSGRGEDAGSPRGPAGRRTGLAPYQVLSLLLHLHVGLPAADGGGARQGWGRRPWRALGFRSRRRRLESGEALLAFTSLAASCLRPVLAGIIVSSPPLPQMTALTFASAARWQFPGLGGGTFFSRFSTKPLKLFTKFLRGAKEPRRCFSRRLHPASLL